MGDEIREVTQLTIGTKLILSSTSTSTRFSFFSSFLGGGSSSSTSTKGQHIVRTIWRVNGLFEMCKCGLPEIWDEEIYSAK